MSSQMFRTLESCATIWLRAEERSVLAFLVKFFNMSLQLFIRLESKLAQFAHKSATVRFDMNRIIAGSIKDQLTLEAGRLKAVKLHAVWLFHMNAEVFARWELSTATSSKALVSFSLKSSRSPWHSRHCYAIKALQHVLLQSWLAWEFCCA